MADLRLALYEPDMPTNTGAMMRLAACLGAPLDIIEPCGFIWDDKKLKRVVMDYEARANVTRHMDWAAFQAASAGRRIVLLTTKGATPYHRFTFQPGDTILMGRESAGVPDHVHEQADARLIVPMKPGLRSLNVAMTAAIVLAEAFRQTGRFNEA